MLNKLITKWWAAGMNGWSGKWAKLSERINDLEEAIKSLSDDDLKAKTVDCVNGSSMAKAWTVSYPKRSPWSAKPRCEPWVCVIMTCS